MDDELHPLDRDYSAIDQPVPRTPLTGEEKFHRVALTIFAIGFALAFVAAIAFGINPGSGSMEGFFSTVQRVGMLTILVGGCLLVVSYRTRAIKARRSHSKGKSRVSRSVTWRALLLWNVAGFVIMSVLLSMIYWTANPFFSFLVVNGLFTLLFAMMVTAAIWHRGIIRAYAIGVLASLFINLFTSLFFMNFPGAMMSGSGIAPFTVIATIQLCGLACAGYVSILESYRLSNSEADSVEENATTS